MTKNQIEYQKLLETMRANRATEDITKSRDEASRRLGLDTLQETARHNQQVELQARDNLAEQYRNNVAQLQELQRSHLASEGLTQQRIGVEKGQLAELGRHNTVTEEEMARHNIAQEYLGQYSSDVNRIASEIAAQSHVTSAGIAASASQYASDNALLAQQLRLDLEKYGIDVNRSTQLSQLSESRRAAVARQAEVNRSNKVQETLQAGSMLQTLRHNLISEQQNARKLDIDLQLGGESNAIKQYSAETQRASAEANISLVPSQKFANYTRGISSLVTPITNVTSQLFKRGK